MTRKKHTSLDYTNALTNSHNEPAQAFDIITANSLVPDRYGKIEIDYVTTGYGVGEIGTVRYYSTGDYQETSITCVNDNLGSAHKTTINFVNMTPSLLAGKAFVVYDPTGAVKIWYNVDFGNTEPNVTGTYRSIQVNLLSSDKHENIAQKTSQKFNSDAQFLAVRSLYYLIISSSSVGIKSDSYDFNTSLSLKNTAGTAAKSLNNKYFFINSALNANLYYVWYNVNGAGVDPLIAGKTGISVSLPLGASADIVATNTKIALDSTGKFLTNIDSAKLIISNKLVGLSTLASEQTSGFLVFTTQQGAGRDLVATLNISYNSSNEMSSVERI